MEKRERRDRGDKMEKGEEIKWRRARMERERM